MTTFHSQAALYIMLLSVNCTSTSSAADHPPSSLVSEQLLFVVYHMDNPQSLPGVTFCHRMHRQWSWSVHKCNYLQRTIWKLEGRSVERIPPYRPWPLTFQNLITLSPVAKGKIDEVWWQSELNSWIGAKKFIYGTYTSVYPDKGWPGSGSTKLDSEAQSVWDGPASKATGHALRPARDWPVPKLASMQACVQTAGHCAVQRSWPMQTFSKSAILHGFPNFYKLRVKIFWMFFSVHVCLWPLWTMKRFWEIRKTVTHRDRRGSFIYIDTDAGENNLPSPSVGVVMKLQHLHCNGHFPDEPMIAGFSSEYSEINSTCFFTGWMQKKTHTWTPSRQNHPLNSSFPHPPSL